MIWGVLLLVAVVVVTVALIVGMFRKPAKKSTLGKPTAGVSTPVSQPIKPKPYADADRLLKEKCYSEAVEAYRNALIKHPKAQDWGIARSRLIEALEGAGLSAAADVELKELTRDLNATSLTPGSAVILGRLDKKRGDPYAAYAMFERGLSLPSSGGYQPVLMLELSVLGSPIGRPDLQFYWATQGLATGGGSIRESLLSMAAHSSLKLGDIDGAERYHQEALEINRKSGNAKSLALSLARTSRVHAGRGEYDRALEMTRQSFELCPDRPPFFCKLVHSQHLAALGNYAEAIDVLTTDDKPANPFLVGLFLSVKEVDRAVQLFDELPEVREPKGLLVRAALGARLAVAKDESNANDRLCAVFDQVENSGMHPCGVVDAVKSLSRGAVAVKNASLALQCAQRLQSQPQLPSEVAMTWFYLGDAHRIGGNVDAAREAYRKAVDSGIRNAATERAASTLAELG